MLENQSLKDVIKYAGGISKDADISDMYFARIIGGKINTNTIDNIENFSSYESKDGDRILLENILLEQYQLEVQFKIQENILSKREKL